MLTVKVLGSGCRSCELLAKLAGKAIDDMGLDATLEKVEDIEEILKYKVLRTPALVINEKVMLSGRVPKMTEMKSLLFSVSLGK